MAATAILTSLNKLNDFSSDDLSALQDEIDAAKDIDDLKKRTSSSIADEVFTQWESNISLNSNSKSADNLSELDDIMPAAEGEQNAAIQILQNLFRAVENFLNNVELDTDENPSPQSC